MKSVVRSDNNILCYQSVHASMKGTLRLHTYSPSPFRKGTYLVTQSSQDLTYSDLQLKSAREASEYTDIYTVRLTTDPTANIVH